MSQIKGFNNRIMAIFYLKNYLQEIEHIMSDKDN